ncbi:RHS repeat-associated core domain-containing protein [Pseudomonas jessenii]|uniref:RHS repeat-associated core domain-containing protein n=1 Tax=Pseudomonas jessenii TaxID=77298 RepID=UPI0030C55E7B
MLPNRETRFCSYRYDPLDRLVDCTPSAQAPTRRFYLKDRLATEIQDAVQRSIMQHDDQLLAQQQRQNDTAETHLLATDQQRSVLSVLDATRPHPLAYSPYGHRPPENGLLSLLGFNGERPDPVTGCYLLGNGYRGFNPVLMRFNSPDSWSPFGKGGLNAYTYCVGDPVNRKDPTGHFFQFLRPLWVAAKPLLRAVGLISKPARPATAAFSMTNVAVPNVRPGFPPPYFPDNNPVHILLDHAPEQFQPLLPPPAYSSPRASISLGSRRPSLSSQGSLDTPSTIDDNFDNLLYPPNQINMGRSIVSGSTSLPTSPPTYSSSQVTNARKLVDDFFAQTVEAQRSEVIKKWNLSMKGIRQNNN